MLTAVRRRYDFLSASVKVPLAVIRECRTALAVLHTSTDKELERKLKHVTPSKLYSYRVALHSELLLVGRDSHVAQYQTREARVALTELCSQ